jgi:hypothetical protein
MDHGAQRSGQFCGALSSCAHHTSWLNRAWILQLFGGSAFAKDMMGVTDYAKATVSQNFVASIVGAAASITVGLCIFAVHKSLSDLINEFPAAPLDVIKTRIQNANFEQKVHGMVVFRELVKNEGPLALFKGLTPKVGHSILHIHLPVSEMSCTAPRGRAEVDIQLHDGAESHSLVRQVRLSARSGCILCGMESVEKSTFTNVIGISSCFAIDHR